MEKWSETDFPHVLKTIILTNDERRRYRTLFRLNRRIRDRLAEVIHTLMEEELATEDEAWDELAKRFDYDDLYALQDAKRAMTVSWITGVISLRGKREEAKENDHA